MKKLRSFKNLFQIKKDCLLEVVYIGYMKIIYTKFKNYNAVTALINYAKIKNYIVFYLDNRDDIYMINEHFFDLSSGFIIFYK